MSMLRTFVHVLCYGMDLSLVNTYSKLQQLALLPLDPAGRSCTTFVQLQCLQLAINAQKSMLLICT